MSDDLIKRSDAIDAIHREARLAGGSVAIEYADMFQDAIKALPSADRPQGEWADVTDELPKQGQDVLAWVETKDDARMACCNYSNSVWFDAIMDVIVSPIAWMPLPMPYHKDERSRR